MKFQEYGLVGGLLFGKFFMGSESQHYGYWIKDMELCPQNFKKAQDNYSRLLLSAIPEDVKTVLDVGCGSGRTAEKL